MDTQTAISRAIKQAGGAEEVAHALGLDRTAILHWIRRGQVPAERVVDLEHLCGGRVRAEQIRPDVFKRRHR